MGNSITEDFKRKKEAFARLRANAVVNETETSLEQQVKSQPQQVEPVAINQSQKLEKDVIQQALEVEQNAKLGNPGLLSADVFDLGKSENAGGMTGSVKAPLLSDPSTNNKGHSYQYKTSIKRAAWMRRAKAKHTDRENFGEVISSKVAMAMLNQDSANNAPAVNLVYDKTNKLINVASRYLDDVKGTLDSYLEEAADLNNSRKRHVGIVSDYDATKHNSASISIEHEMVKPLKKSIAQAIAISALIGDHDINPGNIMVVDDGNSGVKAVRIDFGHALNDLLNAPSRFGGGIKNSKHPILDFFNRQHVAGFPKPATSKMWRDYPGLIPSDELSEALSEMANGAEDRIEKGIKDANAEFSQLLDALIENKDYDGVIHLFKSLDAMHLNFTGSHVDIPILSSLEGKLNQPLSYLKDNMSQAFDNVTTKCKEHATDMKHVSKLMKFQAAVDNFIKMENTLPKDVSAMNEANQNLADSIADIDSSKEIIWVKTDKDSKPFEGNIDEYIKHRQEFLSPKIKARQLEQNIINELQPKIDEMVSAEKSLAAEGMSVNEVLAISFSSPVINSGNPHVERIKVLKGEIEIGNSFLTEMTKSSKGIIQWGSSTISHDNKKIELPAFKGSIEEYIDQRRVNLKFISQRMIKRSETYSSKIDKQFFSKMRAGFSKQKMISDKVCEATTFLENGDVDGAKESIIELKEEFKKKWGNLEKSAGFKVVEELENDIKQAEECENQTSMRPR